MNNDYAIYALPGFACSKQMYAPLVAEIPSVVALENWGMGERLHETQSSEYSLKDLAAFHWKHIQEQNPGKKVVLLGTSMGGFLVQEMALMHPELVSALIFLCTLGPTKAGFLSPTPLTEEGLRMFSTFPKEQQAFFGTESTVHPSLKANSPARYNTIFQYRLNNLTNLEESIKQNKAAINFLAGDIDYEKIKHLPTLILHGANDRFVDPKNAEILKSKFNVAELTFIDEADHFFFMEKPIECGNTIKKFLTNKE